MPVAKLLGTSTPDAMKSEEGTDSLDTFIRQAVGKEPLFSFSRTGDSPTQWIQLLHTFDQQDLPGWPLLAPMKVQMQKCDKCAREFCSPINYRRHIRVHRRSMNFHKDPQKYRDLLGAFWDKLTYDEAKEIVSFKDVNLEEVPGSSIVRNIAANLRKPIFLSLPQVYVKAGSALVDIVQGRPSMLPISSQELFSVLDDASERTFLCAGTTESLKKYVFDGEAGKIGLEIKNLIACTSFLVEQQLVKAWLADKDAEALRCQKLLVEEEEAAQRRQAELLERKRQRKIRQKEQRAREQSTGVKAELYTASDLSESTPLAEISSPSDENIITPHDPILFSRHEEEEDEAIIDIDEGGCGFVHYSDYAANEQQKMQQGSNSLQQHFIARWQVAKSQRGGRHSNQNDSVIKWDQAHKHKEQRVNRGKIWTKKAKPENGVKSRVQIDSSNQTTQSNCQLMIGSISVTLRNSMGQHLINSPAEKLQENINTEVKTKSVKLWRPINDMRGQLGDRRSNGQILEDDASDRVIDQTLTTESHQQSCNLNGNDVGESIDSNVHVEGGAKLMPFSIDAAKGFLSQRWKEAISGDHVELILTSAPEPPPVQDDHQASDSSKEKAGGTDSQIHANVKTKFRTNKAEKSIKAKYIPKQRAVY